MPLPLAPFIFKILVLKIFKGAFIGVFRYLLRIFGKPQVNEYGDSLNGLDHVNQVVNKEWKKKDNLIFLILMLSSAFYGLQEIIVWIWVKFAKWRYPVFWACTPAALELPDAFILRVHNLTWPRITFEIVKWVITASLLYWPKTPHTLIIVKEDNSKWINIVRDRDVFMVRIDLEADFSYRDMHFSINVTGDVQVKTQSGLTANYRSPKSE